MQLSSADPAVFKKKNCSQKLKSWKNTDKTAQKEELMLPNVAYRPTVLKTANRDIICITHYIK